MCTNRLEEPMPNIEYTMAKARKLLPIIYVIDTSGSMNFYGRISAVNRAMNETLDVLGDVAAKNPTADVKVAVLGFSTGAEWITTDPVTGKPALMDLEDFYWDKLKARGSTDLGAALIELGEQLTRDAMLVSETGFKVPVIIFMSDGGPTDDWESAFEKVCANNRWVRAATKIALAVGDNADREVLARIADGNPEAVVPVSDSATLQKLIKVVSVTASMINGRSRTSDSNQNEIVNAVRTEMGMTVRPEPERTDASDISGNDEVWDDLDDSWA
ncbi:vWA domain-containing protein [Slackia heliotrinireducens]|uniref:vWA domain-containing protein n=1 Tax=Slackia heliotrinireducens TaxID=84110 RepID=UPI00331450E4